MRPTNRPSVPQRRSPAATPNSVKPRSEIEDPTQDEPAALVRSADGMGPTYAEEVNHSRRDPDVTRRPIPTPAIKEMAAREDRAVRIWSLHPRYLDRQGLTACWREGLLAQAVLAGRTKGYRHHSQLERFRAQPDPVAAVGAPTSRRSRARPPTGATASTSPASTGRAGRAGALHLPPRRCPASRCPRGRLPTSGPPGGEAGGAQPAAGGGPSRRHQPGRPSVVRGRARPGGAMGAGHIHRSATQMSSWVTRKLVTRLRPQEPAPAPRAPARTGSPAATGTARCSPRRAPRGARGARRATRRRA